MLGMLGERVKSYRCPSTGPFKFRQFKNEVQHPGGVLKEAHGVI